MPIRLLKGSWWVDFQFRGKRIRKRSPINSKMGAKEYEVRLRNRIMNGIPIEEKEAEQLPTFEEFSRKWFDIKIENGKKKPSVIKTYKYLLSGHLVPYFGSTPIDEITNMQIEEFKAMMIKKGRANRTINCHLTILGSNLRCAQEWYGMEKLPKINWLKKPPAKNDFLSDDECEQLLECADGKWNDIILLVLNTGLRLGEIQVLKWSDINWDTRILTVQRARSRGVISSPKSNKARHIPLNEDVYGVLSRGKRKTGYIFPDSEENPLSKKVFYNRLIKICKAAGVRRMGWHLFRHTFASNLAMKGAPMLAIKELLGHSDIQTTMRYTHLAPTTLTNIVALLNSDKPKEKCQPSVNRSILFGPGGEKVKVLLPNIKQKQPPKELF